MSSEEYEGLLRLLNVLGIALGILAVRVCPLRWVLRWQC